MRTSKKKRIGMIVSDSKKKGYVPAIVLSLGDMQSFSAITDKRFKRMLKKWHNKNIYSRIGVNITRIRTDCKLSIKQLANKSAITASYLSNIENGKRQATLLNLEKIARGLKVELRDLIGLEAIDDGLSDKEFIDKILSKRGIIKYVKIPKID